MARSRICVFQAVSRALAQIAEARVEVWLVGQAAEQVGRASGGVVAAGFIETEELGEGSGPQAGRLDCGCRQGWSVHRFIHLR
jgi:hypothetical protein